MFRRKFNLKSYHPSIKKKSDLSHSSFEIFLNLLEEIIDAKSE